MSESQKPATASREHYVQQWGNFGGAYKDKMSTLDAVRADIEKKINVEVNRDNIKEVDEIIKEQKKRLKTMKEERLKFTKQLQAVIDAMMNPEKTAEGSIKQLEEKVTEEKRKIQEERKKSQAYEQEAKNLSNESERLAAKEVEAVHQWAFDKASEAFFRILDKNIPPDQVDEYAAKIYEWIDKLDIPSWNDIDESQYPNLSKEQIQEAKDNIASQVLKQAPIKMLREWFDQFMADYEAAYNNKNEAKEQVQQQGQQEKEEAAKKRVQQEAAAELEGSAKEEGELKDDFKETRIEYQVDLEETEANALLLLKAYVADQDRLREHIRLKKWFNFCPKQVAQAIGKEKTRDNNYQPEGITFKEVHKN